MRDNREKILSAALDLFNKKGSSEVSTNHICEALSISPGNLYYHFRSKDEIIITLFERMIAEWDSSMQQQEPSLESLMSIFEKGFEFLWQYRFIHREISVLFHRIDKFKKIFRTIQERRLNEIKTMMRLYSEAGVLRRMNDMEIDNLARTTWFFSLYWLSYLETEEKKISKNNVKQSMAILKDIFRPYFQKK